MFEVIKQHETLDGSQSYLEVRRSSEGRLSRRFAMTREGAIQSITEAQRALYMSHHRQFGSMTLPAARRFVAEPERHNLLVAVYDPASVSVEAVEDRLQELGLGDEAKVYRDPPFVFLSAQGSEVLKVAREPWASRTMLFDLHPGRQAFGVPVTQEIPDNAIATNSDTEFNANNIFGRNVKVGLVELNNFCGIWAQEQSDGTILGHEAFQSLTGIDYMRPRIPCDFDWQCSTQCETAADIVNNVGVCRDGFCIDQHATAVAARIASHSECGTSPNDCDPADTGDYHAAMVDLYVANNLVNLGSRSQLIDAYNYFVQNDVHIVNESWAMSGAQNGVTVRDVLQDYYARVHDITFVNAAGQRQSGSDEVEPTVCNGFNSLCVGGFAKPSRTSRAHESYSFWTPSSWMNLVVPNSAPDPYSDVRGISKDAVEKPDLVGPAVDAVIPFTAGTDRHRWVFGDGTSYAAPVIAGLIALRSERCSGIAGRPINPLVPRSELRTQGGLRDYAFETNSTCPSGPGAPTDSPGPDWFRYPTPDLRYGCDYRAGVGAVDSADLDVRVCRSTPADPDPRPPSGGGPSPSGYETSSETEVSPTDPDLADFEDDFPGLVVEDPTPGDLGDDKLSLPHVARSRATTQYRSLMRWEADVGQTLVPGRIRASLVHESCPTAPTSLGSSTSLADIPVTLNLDLALIVTRQGDPTPRLVAASENYPDTNEGFDRTISFPVDSLELVLLVPDEASSCPLSAKEHYDWWIDYVDYP
ncbi:MAG TPA: S8/S53 family peptidase [Myxococcales bacterium LLY-WYZ-16_1]|nr:S8/S53 family peptidase [Myxococcales bacterium LLY-WYZ-16_1]